MEFELSSCEITTWAEGGCLGTEPPQGLDNVIFITACTTLSRVYSCCQQPLHTGANTECYARLRTILLGLINLLLEIKSDLRTRLHNFLELMEDFESPKKARYVKIFVRKVEDAKQATLRSDLRVTQALWWRSVPSAHEPGPLRAHYTMSRAAVWHTGHLHTPGRFLHTTEEACQKHWSSRKMTTTNLQ